MAGYALPAMAEEELVVASCRTGSQAGLDMLYRQYAPALVAFCQHRLGGVGDAEDAAHEAILKAHRALPRFREGARLWPWLATIAANICTDMQRARERLGSEQEAAHFEAPEVDEDVSRRLRAGIVETALDEMPERFRTPLFLREFMGWSYEEIAAFSNKSVGSVRTTLMRARRAFQGRVEDVARRQGQWPLPVAAGGAGVARAWRRVRALVRQARESVSRAGSDAANALWRAEGLLGGLGSGLQAAAVALAAAGALTGGAGVAHAASLGATPTGAVGQPLAKATIAAGAGVGAGGSGTGVSARVAASGRVASSALTLRPAAPAGSSVLNQPEASLSNDDDGVEWTFDVHVTVAGERFGTAPKTHVPCASAQANVNECDTVRDAPIPHN